MGEETSIVIKRSATLYDAMAQLNRCASTLTLVVVDEEGKFIGTLTDGDIRRYVDWQETDGPEKAVERGDILEDEVIKALM